MNLDNFMNAMIGLYMIITVLSFSFIGRKIYDLENRIKALEPQTAI